ncbi:MAG: hypothetical protein ISP91_12755 [Pseudomonadales bacterium]|nr:hypothetical protein [Pseudomonadales bacterium]
MKEAIKPLGLLYGIALLLGGIVGGFGSVEHGQSERQWQESEITDARWVDDPLKIIVEAGRWKVSEEVLAGNSKEADALNVKLVAVVYKDKPYALVQQGGESGLEVLRVGIDDLLGEWQVASISEVSVRLVYGEEENELSLFEGVEE